MALTGSLGRTACIADRVIQYTYIAYRVIQLLNRDFDGSSLVGVQ